MNTEAAMVMDSLVPELGRWEPVLRGNTALTRECVVVVRTAKKEVAASRNPNRPFWTGEFTPGFLRDRAEFAQRSGRRLAIALASFDRQHERVLTVWLLAGDLLPEDASELYVYESLGEDLLIRDGHDPLEPLNGPNIRQHRRQFAINDEDIALLANARARVQE